MIKPEDANPMSQFGGALQRIREYNNLADIGEIAHRYSAMNAFDGTLPIIGALMRTVRTAVTSVAIS